MTVSRGDHRVSSVNGASAGHSERALGLGCRLAGQLRLPRRAPGPRAGSIIGARTSDRDRDHEQMLTRPTERIYRMIIQCQCSSPVVGFGSFDLLCFLVNSESQTTGTRPGIQAPGPDSEGTKSSRLMF
jgi:hypothetical protein